MTQIPHEKQPWLMNADEGYVMPDDTERCDARYLGKYRCAHWKDTSHNLHWALGGNLEWATPEGESDQKGSNGPNSNERRSE